MVWLLVLLLLLVFSVFIYSFRFSPITIKGFQLVQFYYLFIATPIMTVCLISMAIEIINRTMISNPFMPDVLLLPFIIFVSVFGAIGAGIHSISVVESEFLDNYKHTKAFRVNNRVHGVISHQMLYISMILLGTSYMFLELNHPWSGIPTSLPILISLGVVMGVLFALSVIWSTFIVMNMIVSFVCLLITTPVAPTILARTDSFPIATILLVALIVFWFLLVTSLVFYLRFKSVCRRCVPLLFPKGHSLRLKLE
jgi:hypothetical protein